MWVNLTVHLHQRVSSSQVTGFFDPAGKGLRKYHLKRVGCAVKGSSSSVTIPTTLGAAAEVGLAPCLSCCACPIGRRMPPDDQVETSTEALAAGASGLRVIRGGRADD